MGWALTHLCCCSLPHTVMISTARMAPIHTGFIQAGPGQQAPVGLQLLVCLAAAASAPTKAVPREQAARESSRGSPRGSVHDEHALSALPGGAAAAVAAAALVGSDGRKEVPA